VDGLLGVVRSGGTVPGVELRLNTRYGHSVDVEVTGYASTGSAAGETTLIMRDVTLRTLLDERRHRLEQMFRALVEHAPSMIYITDAAGRIEFINTAVERMLGYAPRELRGRDLVDIVHPDDRERARWPIHERRTGERATYGFRVRFVKKQGDAATMDLQTVATSLNSVGLYFSAARGGEEIRFAGTEGIAMDVTEVEGLRTLSDGIGRLLPICSTCRKIRTAGPDGDVWEHLEDYVRVHSNAALSHTYCPDCLRKLRLDTGDPA
jgi:PAS domain S-box-containing protein